MKLSANEIKRVRSLARKKFRDELGLFVVEGEKMVAEALESGFSVETVYRREEIGDDTMERISQLASPSPVLALVRKPEINLEIGSPSGTMLGAPRSAGFWSEADGRGLVGVSGADGLRLHAASGLYLALDRLRDPGNLGTIMRVADWFGIDAVFATPDSVDIFNPKVVQATMGAIFRVKFYYTDLVPLCQAVSAAGGMVYGTFLDGENMYSQNLASGSSSPTLIITGNESEGISPEVAAQCTGRLFIPPYPAGRHGSESLNAAVATAITIAEFRRQTR